jgi:hypothetical protein
MISAIERIEHGTFAIVFAGARAILPRPERPSLKTSGDHDEATRIGRPHDVIEDDVAYPHISST